MANVAWSWTLPGLESELLVSQDVANVLENHRQEQGGTECGGQLFVDLGNPYGLMLTLATPPHIADRAGPSWLALDPARCQQEIEHANAKGLRLVGYWHTHPQAIPQISPTDSRSFRKFAKHYSQYLPHPIAVIVGYSQKPEGIKAWSFRGSGYVEVTRTHHR